MQIALSVLVLVYRIPVSRTMFIIPIFNLISLMLKQNIEDS